MLRVEVGHTFTNLANTSSGHVSDFNTLKNTLYRYRLIQSQSHPLLNIKRLFSPGLVGADKCGSREYVSVMDSLVEQVHGVKCIYQDQEGVC